MHPDTDLDEAFDIYSLRDACSLGLDLVDTFAGDVCAVWLGTPEGFVRDLVIFTDEGGAAPDVGGLVGYAVLSARLIDADHAVLWRTGDDLTDAPALADTYFLHLDELAAAGVSLLDEIVLGTDEVRSMAVTTFTDRPGWDDVSSLLDDPDCP